jgi:hypothetical protein
VRHRMRPGTRAERLKKLASAGVWAAMMVTLVLVIVSPGWTLVAGACTLALTALGLSGRVLAIRNRELSPAGAAAAWIWRRPAW